MTGHWIWNCVLALTCGAVGCARGGETSPEDYFEQSVRPLLVRYCVDCHHGHEPKGGLSLDTAQGLLKGADSGPVLDLEHPEQSRLLEVLSHAEDVKMPPMQRLTDDEIAVITSWVKAGAVWNSSESLLREGKVPEHLWRGHWAFQPLRHIAPQSPPESDDPAAWIDAFVAERLAEAGLSPAPQADRRTLIRRLSFDLLGLPPTAAETEAFVTDDAADAYDRLVERLLASPHYGERWGRHWLDLARYSDTRGYSPQEANRKLPFAWTYRDWVVSALNADLPYDRFLIDQIAGDLVPRDSGEGATGHLAALGFLTVGPAFLGGEPDEIDDQLDVLTRGTMGLTVTCARCHDHKYDPIPTADYYSLYGVFAGATRVEVPLLATAADQRRLAVFTAELERRQAPRNAVLEKEKAKFFSGISTRVRDYVLAAGKTFEPAPQPPLEPAPEQAPPMERSSPGEDAVPESSQLTGEDSPRSAEPEGIAEAAAVGSGCDEPEPTARPRADSPTADSPSADQDAEPTAAAEATPMAEAPADAAPPEASAGSLANPGMPELQPQFVDRLASFIRERADSELGRRVFGPWHRFASLSAESFAAEASLAAAEIVRNNRPEATLNPRVAALFETPPGSWSDVVTRYADLFESVEREWRELRAGPTPPEALPEADAEELRQALHDPQSLLDMPLEEYRGALFEELPDEELKQAIRGLEEWASDWKESPQAVPHAVIPRDPDTPQEPVIFKGGDQENPGDPVPRQFLGFLSGTGRTQFVEGTGRLELARAIASPDNPLTPRVLVNRVWMHHFGQPLVLTPSDFGLRSEPPTHPELLDYLAQRFVDGGWSLKDLHRWVVRSKTYRQSTGPNPAASQLDPENRLLWRMNRRRLEFEPLRDAMLAVAGRLDPTLGGRPADLFGETGSNRRSLYGTIDRGNLAATLRTFDFANPKLHSAQRHETIVPQQALYLLNGSFAADQARAVARRLPTGGQDSQRVDSAFRLIFGRSPGTEELQDCLEFLSGIEGEEAAGATRDEGPWRYGMGMVDSRRARVEGFERLTVFVDGQWRPGALLPSPTEGFLHLSAEGGNAGLNPRRAVVRRFIAPAAGTLSIEGELSHPAGNTGNGVRGRIVSARRGSLGQWNVCRESRATNITRILVQAGEEVDFAVESRENDEADEFQWPVKIELKLSDGTGVQTWDSTTDFGGPVADPDPPLNAWEKLALVLLMSNEFAYVD